MTVWTPALEDQVRTLRAEGLAAGAIAIKVGVTYPEIKSKLFELGIYRASRKGLECKPSRSADRRRRNCLKCRREFTSESKGNRMCPLCRRAA